MSDWLKLYIEMSMLRWALSIRLMMRPAWLAARSRVGEKTTSVVAPAGSAVQVSPAMAARERKALGPTYLTSSMAWASGNSRGSGTKPLGSWRPRQLMSVSAPRRHQTMHFAAALCTPWDLRASRAGPSSASVAMGTWLTTAVSSSSSHRL